MLGIRHEEHGILTNDLPFSLYVNIKRDSYDHSKEQNWHDNPEIILITEGEGYVLLDGKRYNVKKGDIAIANSNVLHYAFTDSHIEYTCIIINCGWLRQMNIEYDALRFFPVIHSEYINKLASQLKKVCSNTNNTLRIAKANQLLLDIMIEIAENHCALISSAPKRSKHYDSVISSIDYIHKNFGAKISLSDISKAVFLDKYTLCKEFKKYTGETIIEYINQYRSLKAADYLSSGYTVSKTAELCSYENLSFFTKTFKKYIGTTPSEYKRNARL